MLKKIDLLLWNERIIQFIAKRNDSYNFKRVSMYDSK